MNPVLRAFAPRPLFAALLLALSAVAVGQTVGQTSAQLGTIDVDRSRIFVFVGKTGFGHDHGVTGLVKSGTLHLGREREAGEIVFDMTSFDADTPEARKYVGLQGETDEGTRKQVNANMHGAAILNTGRFPTAVLKIDSALPLRPAPGERYPRYELVGTWTLVGVAKPIKLVCEVIPEKGALRVRTGFAVLQSTFGIKPFTKAFGAVGVADELKIYGEMFVAAE